MNRRLPATPFFLQTIGLVIFTLVAAQLISVAVILLSPPPTPEFYRVSEIAQAVRNGEVDTRDGRALVARVRDHQPFTDRNHQGRRRNELKAVIARAIDVEPSRIVLKISMQRRLLLRPGPPPPRIRRALQEQKGGPPPELRQEDFLVGPFKMAVQQPDGRWMVVQPKPSFRPDAWQTRLLLVLGLSILAVTPLVWMFARRLAAPISAFADAAERLGRDPGAPPLELRGSSEVKAAAAAFNQMQERLRRYVEDRTAMIGAIAHDMRTPLTRLRFRIEAAPEEMRGKMAAEIDQMDEMISAAITFVRDATREGERTKLELTSLLESVIDDAAEVGAAASVEQADRIVIDGDPLALRRLVSNLVDNAIKYGGAARGRAYAEDGSAIIEIEDDGPGVPDNEMDRVFDPFYRGEPSRNRETGGIGLGLAVVRSIARSHGGDVTLHNRPGGGLTARVRLPL
ncbi:ATP-binding protein [Caulobacter sp. NIBR2454]|uniref:ATP-binding protein n=1 Tax=Caulobacter sp. NIBR2454 TaxID=3015996 RepID=UPI0022B7040E|nr:ATP-binding protein [Caulobacter sp. NIBR2454]